MLWELLGSLCKGSISFSLMNNSNMTYEHTSSCNESCTPMTALKIIASFHGL